MFPIPRFHTILVTFFALLSSTMTLDADPLGPCAAAIHVAPDEAFHYAVGGTRDAPAREILRFDVKSAGVLWVEAAQGAASTTLRPAMNLCREDAAQSTTQARAFLVEETSAGVIIGIDRAGPIFVEAKTQAFDLAVATAFVTAEASVETLRFDNGGHPFIAHLIHLRSPSSTTDRGAYLAGSIQVHQAAAPRVGENAEVRKLALDSDQAPNVPGQHSWPLEISLSPLGQRFVGHMAWAGLGEAGLGEAGRAQGGRAHARGSAPSTKVEEREVDPDPDAPTTPTQTGTRVEEREVDPDPDAPVTPTQTGTQLEEKEVDPDPDAPLAPTQTGTQLEEKEVDPDPDAPVTPTQTGTQLEEKEVDPDPDAPVTPTQTGTRVVEKEVESGEARR